MALISTRTHYPGGSLLLSAPFARDRRAVTLGVVLIGGALLLRRRGARARSWLPPLALGAGELALALRTESETAGQGTSQDVPGAPTGVTGEGLAAQEPATSTAVAPAPPETPGPSVTPPAQPESDIERTERIDEALPDEVTGDALVAQQEAAAAAEAGAIGGRRVSETGDPAMDPVYEAGGGEEEGFEGAEAQLIENATHGDGRGDPLQDAANPEVESDRATAVYGEADEIASSEVPEAERPD